MNGLHITLFVSAALLLVGALMARRLPRVMECPAEADELDGPDGLGGPDEVGGAGAAGGSDELREAVGLSAPDEGCGTVGLSAPDELCGPDGSRAHAEPRVPATREAIEPAGSGRPAH